MGYYTRHELEIKENRSNLSYDEVLKQTVEKLDELGVINYALDYDLAPYNDVKWYEHKRDMKQLSLEVKDVLFELSGEGEETGDAWKEYWINGKYQRCQAELVYPKFDEGKLELYSK